MCQWMGEDGNSSDGNGEVEGLGSSARDICCMLLCGELAVSKSMSQTPSPTPTPRHDHNRHEVANPRTTTFDFAVHFKMHLQQGLLSI